MRRPLRILVRLDANHRIGLAHAVRVSGMLQLLEVSHTITVAGEGDALAAFFPEQRVVPVSAKDPEAFVSLIPAYQPDLILVDHPRLGAGFWRALRAHRRDTPVVAIDDEGGDLDADVIVNGTVVDEYHRYPSVNPNATLLIGPQYALVHPVFGSTQWRNPSEHSVVVVVGSGDRARHWVFDLVSGKVDLNGWGRVRIIVGRAFPDLMALRRTCAASGVSVDCGVSGQAVAQALSESSVALMTGGMIVYEAAAVGAPAIIFPQLENLIPEARWFAERNCAVDLGYEAGADVKLAAKHVAALLSAPSRRVAMSSSQRAVIDGRGMARVARVLNSLSTDGAARA